ncbi:MAG: alanine/glycine:cation symporter family protein [Steroidobacteraceae bacterium]
MDAFNSLMVSMNAVLWHNVVLYGLIVVGVLFTVWSRFGQAIALTHGWRVVRGQYDDPSDPGAINHFQALSAALSATVGLGNIGGVALAISLGGPGAVFWMWVIGFIGMAIKMTEVTLSMLYRDTSDPDEPRGGPMWVVKIGLSRLNPGLGWVGTLIGGLFCVTLLVATITGGNMFQAWNVGKLTQSYFGIPSIFTGIVLAILVALVIIGGIKRIGSVAGHLVPVMMLLYIVGGLFVLAVHIGEIPAVLGMIIKGAFAPTEAAGAFIGGTFGSAFLFGMKRALFSNEAGQGSSPIAHSAAKTNEPVREGVVAGLEPFIDTLVVCTFTALVILSTGVWNRGPDAMFSQAPAFTQQANGSWVLDSTPAPALSGGEWLAGEPVYTVIEAHENEASGNARHRLEGSIVERSGQLYIDWESVDGGVEPTLVEPGVYDDYAGATLTAKAFDQAAPGLGKWLVTLAAWLFAISTMISWSYYGEQGMVYMLGRRSVLPYKVFYCAAIVVATTSLIQTDTELDNLTGVGTGLMLFVNIPIMLIFGAQAMKAYHSYVDRLRKGEMPMHAAPSIADVVAGRDGK